MGFKEFFDEAWSALVDPYGKEEGLVHKFSGHRPHDFPTQYNSSTINFETYTYNVDAVCSFLIVEKRGIGDIADPWNYSTIESISLFPNPKRIALSEPTRQEITALQYNSKLVERGGMPIKTLAISGNFGYFSGRDKVAPQGTLPRDGVGSGLFFSKLWSSFFRYYEEMVTFQSESNDYQLVFIDHVKQESWFVEPNSIDSEQTDGQKFQHPYNWTFTALAPYDYSFIPLAPEGIWQNITSVVSDLKEYAGELERITARLSKYVTDFTGEILNPLYDIMDAIDSVLNGIDNVISIPKQVISQVEFALADLQETLDFQKDDDNYPLEIDASYVVQKTKNQLKKISNTQEFFIPESNYADNNNNTLYEAPRMNKETGEVLERGENAPIVATETIKEGDTIQTIAKRVFGTFKGWEEIVAMNGLRPPYIATQDEIDTQELKGVVAYGEEISFTKNGKFSKIKVNNKSSKTSLPIINDTTRTKRLSPFERALGTDIALVNGDIQFTKDNDFKTVSGLDNVKQQIGHKFSIEKGKLKSSEYIGITKTTGREGALANFTVKQDINSMVNADDRLIGANVSSERNGDVLEVSAKIDIKDLKEPLPVKIRQGY